MYGQQPTPSQPQFDVSCNFLMVAPKSTPDQRTKVVNKLHRVSEWAMLIYRGSNLNFAANLSNKRTDAPLDQGERAVLKVFVRANNRCIVYTTSHEMIELKMSIYDYSY